MRPAVAAPLALAVLALAACTPATGESDVTASPAPSTAPPELAVVDPGLVAGMDARVEEDLSPGLVTFATVPEVPGAEGFTDEIQAVVDADVDRFVADTPPREEPPYPEMLVSWDLRRHRHSGCGSAQRKSARRPTTGGPRRHGSTRLRARPPRPPTS